ncbi:immunoglobulin domain-containing protein [Streptomyces sp. NPDC127108]|uniref:immunoglobulin domain-containing protein n=1 Tax=Streptomyces sp. NPDC127108 TaxID=3345361 RepID=UPI00362763C7
MRRTSLLAASALTLAALGTGFAPAGPEGTGDPDSAEEKVSYRRTGDFTTAGRPLDVTIHPDSKKLYVGSDDDAGTADVNEMGLYVLDRSSGAVRGRTAKAPGSNGVPRESAVRKIAAPLPGDGVVFHYPLKGLGTAKDGDPEAKGVWLAGAKVTDVGPGVTDGTTLVAQGAVLTEVETATGAAKRTLTLPGAGQFAVDAARKAVWSADLAQNKLYRIDTTSFTVTKTVELPVKEGTEGFTAVDPATGSVWVGRQDKVMVFGPDGVARGTVDGKDLARDVAFDGSRAYVARQDVGDPGAPDYDGRGSLTVLDTGTLKPVAEPVPLPGNEAQLGYAAVAVAPGGAEVFVTSPAQNRITRIERNTPPKVTASPADVSADDGAEVTLTARAEGSPEPTVRWQRSTDGGRSWTEVEGATKPSYTFTARARQDGHRYRAEFSNDAGTAHSEPATLKIRGKPGDEGSATGPGGQRLTVTPVNELAPKKQQLTVTGAGYDEKKGIYVALCVDNGPGKAPTPCVGGAATDGGSKASAWISNNPPPHGADLAVPYGKDGSFEVELTVDAKDGSTDCRTTRCVLATRADHTLPGDRSQDVRVPVTFADGDGPGGGDGNGNGGTDDGGSGGGGSAGGSDSGGSGDAGGSGTTGSGGSGGSGGAIGDTGDAGSDGSLASTGQTVGGAAALAAALTAAGWYTMRRARRGQTPRP